MTLVVATGDEVGFDQFLEEWLAEVREGDPSTVELGRRFARKLAVQWLDLDADSFSTDVVYCDGTGDGGIDLAYLDRGEEEELSENASGHTWYLVQSKYGSAFQGSATLLQETQKVIETLDGRRQRLSSLAEGLLERLNTFRDTASERDRIVLVFAAERSLDEGESETLRGLRAMGRERLGPIFDIEAVSVETIYQRIIEETPAARYRLAVPLKGHFVPSGDDLMVGFVSLIDLYDFLVSYRSATEDLDQLYEKNVRRFLGSKGRINKGIEGTLRGSPEWFGLYNNGITIVVTDFERQADDTMRLTEPYIVNGCQTTRTIWEVCHQKLEAGGTGENLALEEWQRKAVEGVVITKIVKVEDATGEGMLQNITRFTNSQNAVREKDFLALTSDFRRWSAQMADQYDVFLEIQRGAWDSQRALQKQRPTAKQFDKSANAFDLIKVYGAGWLGEAGLAFGKNPPFLPNGSVFKRIVNEDGAGEPFGLDDLYAAYLVQQAANEFEFGRGGRSSRRQTRFLFYMVLVDLLKDVLTRAHIERTPKNVSWAFLKLFSPGSEDAAHALLDAAVNAIDTYMTQGEENSVFEEPVFRNTFNGDVNGYLKWEGMGKSSENSPRLKTLIEVTKMAMGQTLAGTDSGRARIMAAIA